MSSKTLNKHTNLLDKPLIPALIAFTIPAMLSGWLQLLFNAADLMVVGNFDPNGAAAQAAIGSTGSLINLIVNLFIGFAAGANVIVAHNYAANDNEKLTQAVRTSVFVGFVTGVAVAIIGLCFASPILTIMDTNAGVINLAADYLRIYFLGAPFIMLYNFGSSILRAIGDTKRPMIFLTIAGVVNILLNLFTVIVLGWGIIGVAVATTASNVISAVLTIICIIRTKESYKLVLKNFKVSKQALKQIISFGVPSGISTALFSFSNIIIQSAINSFGSESFTAGNGNASNIEGFAYVPCNCFYQAALTFSSQCCGAKRHNLLGKVFSCSLILATLSSVIMGAAFMLFRTPLMGLYSSDPEVVKHGAYRILCICSFYFLVGIMDVSTGMLRGIGKPLFPMVVSIIGVCGFRVAWVYTVFERIHTPGMLYMSYPISWAITFTALCVCFHLAKKKLILKESLNRLPQHE